ncbi:hypothetical protein ABMA71_15270 [Halobacteriovorax sp. ZH3_bin.1]|uniref:hypothetical protein n=1 Tax=Halobacteriovorax sp. ZH3_bin.1 TaxID=3157725 RepID=UPI00371F37E7
MTANKMALEHGIPMSDYDYLKNYGFIKFYEPLPNASSIDDALDVAEEMFREGARNIGKSDLLKNANFQGAFRSTAKISTVCMLPHVVEIMYREDDVITSNRNIENEKRYISNDSIDSLIREAKEIQESPSLDSRLKDKIYESVDGERIPMNKLDTLSELLGRAPEDRNDHKSKIDILNTLRNGDLDLLQKKTHLEKYNNTYIDFLTMAEAKRLSTFKNTDKEYKSFNLLKRRLQHNDTSLKTRLKQDFISSVFKQLEKEKEESEADRAVAIEEGQYDGRPEKEENVPRFRSPDLMTQEKFIEHVHKLNASSAFSLEELDSLGFIPRRMTGVKSIDEYDRLLVENEKNIALKRNLERYVEDCFIIDTTDVMKRYDDPIRNEIRSLTREPYANKDELLNSIKDLNITGQENLMPEVRELLTKNIKAAKYVLALAGSKAERDEFETTFNITEKDVERAFLLPKEEKLDITLNQAELTTFVKFKAYGISELSKKEKEMLLLAVSTRGLSSQLNENILSIDEINFVESLKYRKNLTSLTYSKVAEYAEKDFEIGKERVKNLFDQNIFEFYQVYSKCEKNIYPHMSLNENEGREAVWKKALSNDADNLLANKWRDSLTRKVKNLALGVEIEKIFNTAIGKSNFPNVNWKMIESLKRYGIKPPLSLKSEWENILKTTAKELGLEAQWKDLSDKILRAKLISRWDETLRNGEGSYASLMNHISHSGLKLEDAEELIKKGYLYVKDPYLMNVKYRSETVDMSIIRSGIKKCPLHIPRLTEKKVNKYVFNTRSALALERMLYKEAGEVANNYDFAEAYLYRNGIYKNSKEFNRIINGETKLRNKEFGLVNRALVRFAEQFSSEYESDKLMKLNTFKQMTEEQLLKIGYTSDDIKKLSSEHTIGNTSIKAKLLEKETLMTPKGAIDYYYISKSSPVSGKRILQMYMDDKRIGKKQGSNKLMYHDLKVVDAVFDTVEKLKKKGLKVVYVRNEATQMSMSKKDVKNEHRNTGETFMDSYLVVQEEGRQIAIGGEGQSLVAVEYGNYRKDRMEAKIQNSTFDHAYIYSNKTYNAKYERWFGHMENITLGII